MKILNISTIIPLEDLKRENDIVLRVQDYLQKEYGYEFKIAKSLPYVNKVLAAHSRKWERYLEYQKVGLTNVQGYQTLVYPWIAPPTSKFWINYLFVPLNWIWFKVHLQKKFSVLAKNADLFVAQNTIPDALVAYWLHEKYGKPYLLNLRGNIQRKFIFLPLFDNVFKKAFKVITHSPTIYNNLKQSINIRLLPHPVDEKFFSEEKMEFSSMKLVSVCRLLRLKNIDWVISALASLNQKGYKFEYHIVGDGRCGHRCQTAGSAPAH